MVPYGAVQVSKYGKRVLLERIIRLLVAIKLSPTNWLAAYVRATRSINGELALCEDAVSLLVKLQTMPALANQPAPVQLISQVPHCNTDCSSASP